MQNQQVGIDHECIIREADGAIRFVNNPAFPNDPRIAATERCNAGGHDAADLLLLDGVPVYDIGQVEAPCIVFDVRF